MKIQPESSTVAFDSSADMALTLLRVEWDDGEHSGEKSSLSPYALNN